MSNDHDVELDIFLGEGGSTPRLICYSCKQTLIMPVGINKGYWLNMVNEFKDKHTCSNVRIGWSELVRGGAFWTR